MSNEKILVVDDEKDIRDIVGIYLESNGYASIKAENGKEALELLEKENTDLALLDIMLPDIDGISLCLKIRANKNIPIIMLSAKDQEMDIVMGLTSGADDYIAKPFNPVELLARVRAQLRRFKELNPDQINGQILKYQNLKLDLDTHKLTKNNEEIRLTPTEFKILNLLWRNKGIVFSTEKIYQRVWQEEDFEIDNTVMVHIRNLRDKVEDNNKKPLFIQTVWGIGYKFGE
jgi:DNA-binding response OmpR family regulator